MLARPRCFPPWPSCVQLDIIDELVQDAVRGGAKVLCGGKRNAALAPGLFYEPTVRASLCAMDPRPVLQQSSTACAVLPVPSHLVCLGGDHSWAGCLC